LADVRVFRFVAEFGWEFFVAAMDVTVMAGQNRAVGPVIYREWKAEHFPEAGVEAHVAAAGSTHYSVTERRGISVALIDSRDLDRQLGDSEYDVRQAAAELARRAVFVRRRILNVSERSHSETENERDDEQVFHGDFSQLIFRRKSNL
jgi:hypothetical protein